VGRRHNRKAASYGYAFLLLALHLPVLALCVLAQWARLEWCLQRALTPPLPLTLTLTPPLTLTLTLTLHLTLTLTLPLPLPLTRYLQLHSMAPALMGSLAKTCDLLVGDCQPSTARTASVGLMTLTLTLTLLPTDPNPNPKA
jgi:hypothetical protein